MKKIINAGLNNSVKAKQDFVAAQQDDLIRLVRWTIETFDRGGKLLIMGNGGSAADAQHLAAEFVNRFLVNRAPLPALALTTDSSILTSVGNDFSFDDIFVKQVQALAKKEDLLLGISTSGNSPNILSAIETAKKMGLKTVALTGGSGGRLIKIADLTLNVPSAMTPHIQETHLWIEHMLCWLVDEELQKRKK
jgi:D-sedoheptulose 7-phosphate isomerase